MQVVPKFTGARFHMCVYVPYFHRTFHQGETIKLLILGAVLSSNPAIFCRQLCIRPKTRNPTTNLSSLDSLDVPWWRSLMIVSNSFKVAKLVFSSFQRASLTQALIMCSNLTPLLPRLGEHTPRLQVYTYIVFSFIQLQTGSNAEFTPNKAFEGRVGASGNLLSGSMSFLRLPSNSRACPGLKNFLLCWHVFCRGCACVL